MAEVSSSNLDSPTKFKEPASGGFLRFLALECGFQAYHPFLIYAIFCQANSDKTKESIRGPKWDQVCDHANLVTY